MGAHLAALAKQARRVREEKRVVAQMQKWKARRQSAHLARQAGLGMLAREEASEVAALQAALRKLGRARRGPPAVAKHRSSGTVAMQESPCAAGSASTRRLGASLEQALPLEASAAGWHLGEPPSQGCMPRNGTWGNPLIGMECPQS